MNGLHEKSYNEKLQQELSGAKRLSEFRLHKIIELQDELVRLRRLLLTMRGGSEALQRAGSAKPRENSVLQTTKPVQRNSSLKPNIVQSRTNGKSSSTSSSPPATRVEKTTPTTPAARKVRRRQLSSRSPSVTVAPPTTDTTVGINGSSPAAVFRGASPKPHMPSLARTERSTSSNRPAGNFQRPSVTPKKLASRQPSSTAFSISSQPRATARPLIKLHTGVQLRGPKTFRRVPPPSLSLRENKVASAASVVAAPSTSNGGSVGSGSIPPSPLLHFSSSATFRREYNDVREAVAMLRGIVLRADRNMLSTLTNLSNRRSIERALPTALTEFKQCLLRVHPSLVNRLPDGEAWRIGEEEQDALEVVEVPGMTAALREIVITYDYTVCVFHQVLQQNDGTINIKLGRAFHEFFANMYVLLALAQCPTALR
ncbi:uncharacterized protein TM35_000791130 [Trypanosoma theileri]|uniref:Uncharacterized protein n=1 Tax=Trypanosoma theileri TaxID=67003 RepID=A0A1X0NFJ2_9TRYP|nr:uncharacterized protein TM35_000791130 [Trypanosoma theileri]ORC82987.1 hypothetical protein TM35_000791130 [Trypanosoma theileri]